MFAKLLMTGGMFLADHEMPKAGCKFPELKSKLHGAIKEKYQKGIKTGRPVPTSSLGSGTLHDFVPFFFFSHLFGFPPEFENYYSSALGDCLRLACDKPNKYSSLVRG